MDEQKDNERKSTVDDKEVVAAGLGFIKKQIGSIKNLFDSLHVSRRWKIIVWLLVLFNFFSISILSFTLRISLFPNPTDILFTILFLVPIPLVGMPIGSVLIAIVPLSGLLNIILLSCFIHVYKPQGRFLFLLRVIILLSIGLLLWLTYNFVTSARQAQQQETGLSQEKVLQLITDCSVTKVYKPEKIILDSQEMTKEMRETYDIDNLERARVSTKEEINGTTDHYLDNNEDYEVVYEAYTKATDHCDWLVDGDLLTTAFVDEIQAKELLNSCQIRGFYYGSGYGTFFGEYDPAFYNQPGAPSALNTGIILSYKENPIRLYVELEQISTMLPVAQTAQQQCPHLQIWNGNERQIY